MPSVRRRSSIARNAVTRRFEAVSPVRSPGSAQLTRPAVPEVDGEEPGDGRGRGGERSGEPAERAPVGLGQRVAPARAREAAGRSAAFARSRCRVRAPPAPAGSPRARRRPRSRAARSGGRGRRARPSRSRAGGMRARACCDAKGRQDADGTRRVPGQERPSRASRTRVTASGKTMRIASRTCIACSSLVPWRFSRLIGRHGELDGKTDRVVGERHALSALHLLGELAQPALELLGIAKRIERLFHRNRS